MRAGRCFALLTLLVTAGAAAQDRPERTVVELERATLITAEGSVLDVEGGVWLPGTDAGLVGRELAALRTEVGKLREAPSAPPLALVYVAGLALAVGVGIGLVAGRELAK